MKTKGLILTAKYAVNETTNLTALALAVEEAKGALDKIGAGTVTTKLMGGTFGA